MKGDRTNDTMNFVQTGYLLGRNLSPDLVIVIHSKIYKGQNAFFVQEIHVSIHAECFNLREKGWQILTLKLWYIKQSNSMIKCRVEYPEAILKDV